jgi:hypothetical protein
LIHPVARNFHDLYGEHLDLMTIEDIDKQLMDQLVVVEDPWEGSRNTVQESTHSL